MINAKKAKRLRREARALTKGQPPVDYIAIEHPDRLAKVDVGTPRERIVTVKRVTYRLAETCTRAVYQQLKRGKMDLDAQLAALMSSAPTTVAEAA